MRDKGFICDRSKVQLRHFTFKLDAESDYVNSRIYMQFFDGNVMDGKDADLDFVPDALLEDIVHLVEWLEEWEGRQVFELTVRKMDLEKEEFDCYIKGRRKTGDEPMGRFWVPSSKLPENIKRILIRWWKDILGAYGRRIVGIYVPLGDVPVGAVLV